MSLSLTLEPVNKLSLELAPVNQSAITVAASEGADRIELSLARVVVVNSGSTVSLPTNETSNNELSTADW